MNINQAKNAIKACFKRQVETGKRISIDMRSGPGMGKSSIAKQAVEELAKEMGRPVGFKTEFLSTVDSIDVRGPMVPVKVGDKYHTISAVPRWMVDDSDPEFGILFLDEWAQADASVQKPAAELVLDGRVGEHRLPITWMVVCASNREGDRSGVQREMAFITNRVMRLNIQPSLDAWVEWAERCDIDWRIVSYAKAFPGDVFADEVPKKPGPFCTPRTLVAAANLLDSGMDMSLLTEAIAGYVGEGVGAKIMSHLRVAASLPDFADIVRDPAKTPVPGVDRPDAQYAVMQMVSHRVDGKTAVPAFKYLQRLPREFQVAGIRAALRRAPGIVNHKDFANWLVENRELLANANVNVAG